MSKISFCGISGSGMSSLAQILKLAGHIIQGSDRNFDLHRDEQSRSALEKFGIKIFPQDGSGITNDLDFVCASTAVEDTILDIKAAKDKGIAIKTRPQLLGEIFNAYKCGIAIGGTSGKTTTTAMIGYILDKAGKLPCMINGGLLRDYEDIYPIPNIIYNKGDICVVEADESNGSIELYNPYIAIVNNISQDHKSLSELSELFQHFADHTSHAVIINDDYDLCRQLKHSNLITFSLSNPQANFFASNLKSLPHGTQYDFAGKTFTLNLIGEFNVSNALAAIAACQQMGVDKYIAAEILQSFHGTKRRMEVIGQENNITVIDDFAHNPDKVRASVKALRQYSGRLIIMFQPHGFSPMRSLGKEIMQEFHNYLNPDDIFIMPEIFFVGGSVTKDISSADLIAYIKSLGRQNAYFVDDKAAAEKLILSLTQPNDRIVIMGARDNMLTTTCFNILKGLKK